MEDFFHIKTTWFFLDHADQSFSTITLFLNYHAAFRSLPVLLNMGRQLTKVRFRTNAQAFEYVGGLSKPTKIPTYCYSIPADRCIAGSALSLIPGSTCSECYAKKGWHYSNQVAPAEERRFRSLKKPYWVEGMVYLINSLKLAYFRWHDSGDIQGLWHLMKIFEVCLRTPNTKHWLPTREWDMIRNFRELDIPKPSNLKIILSAHMIDKLPPVELAKQLHVQVSAVVTENPTCQAHTKTVRVKNGRNNITHGYCGSCRDCWNESVFFVSYIKH